MFFGEDKDSQCIPRNDPTFERILDFIRKELSHRNFNIFDETSATISMPKIERIKRNKRDVIRLARSIDSNHIDVAVILSLYVTTQSRWIYDSANLLIHGRVLRVHTGQYLDSFETSIPSITISKSISQRQLFDSIGNHSVSIAKKLGQNIMKEIFKKSVSSELLT